MKQMLFHITLIINLLFSSVFAQERTVGVFNNTAEAFEGYTLFSPAANNMVYLVDNCGRLVNSWECSAKPGNAIYLTTEGFLYRAAQMQNLKIFAGGAGGLAHLRLQPYAYSVQVCPAQETVYCATV